MCLTAVKTRGWSAYADHDELNARFTRSRSLLTDTIAAETAYQVVAGAQRIPASGLAVHHVTIGDSAGRRRAARVAMVATGPSIRVTSGRVRSPAVSEDIGDRERKERRREGDPR